MLQKFRINNIIVILLFCLAIALPILDSVFGISPVKNVFEKRLATSAPQMPQNLEEFWQFPRKFEQYYNDNYGFRKSFIAINSTMMDKIFDEPSDSRVVFGNEGWLYFDNYNSLLDISGDIIIDDKIIAQGVEAFYKNWQELKDKNITYLLIIAADKAVIYPEFLPDYIKISDRQSVDKFIDKLTAKYPDFPILDLRPTLLSAKEKEVIFHKTDTHWNARGAHYAYVNILQKLNQLGSYKFKPNLRDRFLEKSDKMLRGDIADILNLDIKNIDYNLLPNFKISYQAVDPSLEEKNKFHKPKFFTNNNQKLPVLFAYKDSFFGNLEPFMAEHFAKSYLINEFPCNIEQKVIKPYKPDFVIQQFWQSRAESIFKSCR